MSQVVGKAITSGRQGVESCRELEPVSARALANQVRIEFHPNSTDSVVGLSYFRSLVRDQASAMNVLVLSEHCPQASRQNDTMASNGLPFFADRPSGTNALIGSPTPEPGRWPWASLAWRDPSQHPTASAQGVGRAKADPASEQHRAAKRSTGSPRRCKRLLMPLML